MDNSEIVSVRVSPLMKKQLAIKSSEHKVGEGEVVRTYISEGLKNEKINKEFDDLQKTRESLEGFMISDLKIKLLLKKSSLVDNFKKIIMEIQAKKCSRKVKSDLYDALLERIQKQFGEKSQEWATCYSILHERGQYERKETESRE